MHSHHSPHSPHPKMPHSSRREQSPPMWGRHSPPPWRRGRPPKRWIVRLLLFFGAFSCVVAAWMGAIAFLVTSFMGGSGHTARLVWVIGGGLILLLPILAAAMGRIGFNRYAQPMVYMMQAAEGVMRGDLSVRVPQTDSRGDLNRFMETFNRMVAELERADHHRRNMTADIAHELRTPLHVIQGNLEGVLDGVYEPTAEHITATLAETRILARLVEDLRTLSLAEAEQLPLAREMVDVHDLLADVVTGFSGQSEAQGITLRADTPTAVAPLRIMGDAGRLDQVLSNLVANALRHTPRGGEIILRAVPVPQENMITLTVSDNGEGIPAADLPYIFDRFWRGDHARSRTGSGSSGLGLAIARQLVQAHGGRIEVTSSEGTGTTFTMELPYE